MKWAAFAVLLGCVACDPPAPSSTPAAGEPAIAAKWRARCGNCHVRVEPGTHTRSELETALARHHKRVRLTDDQWAQLVAFLASDSPSSPALSIPCGDEKIVPAQAPVPPIPPPAVETADAGNP